MILLRKPFTLFDVDVLGLLGLLGLGAVAGWLVVQTAAVQTGLRELQARLRNAEPQRRQQLQKLESLQQELDALRAEVAARQAEAPGADAVAGFVGQIAHLAADTGLDLQNVTPGPIAEENGRLHCDVQVVGRGGSLDFVRFLFQLAARNPYQTLRTFTINRPAGPEPPICQITWTLRLYMVAPPKPLAGEPPPGPEQTGRKAGSA